ncbi:MAG: acyltransferase [Proteobacteria bacterium]|nr:acyltransferase [Pseudomonadota bacterium]MBS0493954.1 acyltransferase [Pseudomonadota bacterium]
MSHVQRSALIDSTKGLACAAIVWHHLAFYGPMADLVRQDLPDLIGWLYEYARMAVQVFLVLGGFLAAASLAPQGHARFDDPWLRIARRFVRLVVPYAVALVLAILVQAAVRPWFNHDSVSADPSLWQLLAHALLLQGVLGEESLSAGVWYVAIDFQLFALTTLLLAGASMAAAALRARWGSRRLARYWPWAITGVQALVVVGVAASLLGFNLDAQWDNWAVYFFGAYGLGMLAFWAVQSPRTLGAWGWALLMVALVLAALVLQWRGRVALAGATALALVISMRLPALMRWQGWKPLNRLGQMSYSVFLVHFAVCLTVNAVESHFWPQSIFAAELGMVLAFVLSVAAGHVLYQRVERHTPTWQAALRWQAGLVGTGLLTTAVLAGMH